MKHAHTRHLRCITPYEDAQEAFNRASHGDALREMQIVPFDRPLEVVRSIERSEAIWSTFIFLALGFCVGALFAIGN